MNTIKHYFRYDTISTGTIGLLLLITSFLFTSQIGYAIEISDVPMATQIQKAPPNIMFVIDNSGSMNWEVMVAGSNQGRWFSTVTNSLHTRILSDWVDIKPEWPSQWSEVNKIYYNQKVTYTPWPHPDTDIERMPDADTTEPVRNPYDLINGNTDPDTTDLTRIYYTLAAPAVPDIIIVDNQDSNGFAASGHFDGNGNWISDWHESGLTPEWQGSSVYSSVNGAIATFTPTIPIEADYDVYAWWNCYAGRDQHAKITITYIDSATGLTTSVDILRNQRSSSNNTCESGVCGEWIPLGTYHFADGTAGSVAISHDTSTGSNASTVADAIMFAPAGTEIPLRNSIDINYAHYFTGTWDDGNGNGLVDDGEIQHAYLVNFQGQDNCGGPAPPTPTRQIYEINDINDNGILDDGSELIPITELPETLRPKIYDENGVEIGDMDATTELQNFANWFSYYRTRALAAKAAVGSVINDADGVRVGFYSIHDHDDGITRQPVLNVKIPGETDETSTLLWHLYEMTSSGGTPLRRSLRNVGRYFDSTNSDDTHGLGNDSPYYDEEHGGACQHAFAIVMTDGFWNSSSPGIGNADGGEPPPYAGSDSNTLADVAMYYYNRDLSSTLPDQLPATDCDKTTAQTMHQHMVTFSVSFGLNGEINIDDMNSNSIPDIEEDFNGDGDPDGLSYKTDPCFIDSNTPIPRTPDVNGWPTPSANQPSTIDDLWHAAINGRGEFFSASNPEELVKALVAIFDKVQKITASEAAFTIDGDVISSNTKVFGPSYDSATWTGEVKAMAFNEDGNFQYDAGGKIIVEWKASEQLINMDWDSDRKIVTMHDGNNSGIPFRWSNISTDQKTLLEDNEDILKYVRGKNDIPTFRNRINNDLETENILGDIVHSSPVISPSGETIFVGSNDGMLHAFNANTGDERFAYIPNLVFSNLAGLKETTFYHRFFVDATPALWPNVNGETLLVGGLGKGGKGFYALNVTDADTLGSDTESNIASSIVKWEYPAPGDNDPDMGYSFSSPFIVKSNLNGKWVVIFGNGYNSSNEHAVLYILDADTGIELARLDTGVGGDNGLSTPALIDLDNDYKVDVVYAGDLKGNLWKFDLSDSNPSNWDVAFSGTALFSADGPSSNSHPQPITVKPAVMHHPLRHGLMVLFGTGKFLGESDRIDTDVQTLYGIWDYSDADNSEYVGSFTHSTGAVGGLPGVTLLEQERIHTDFGNDVSQFLVHGNDGNGTDGVAVHLLRVTSDRDADWSVDSDTPLPNPANGSNVGWYFDLPLIGERLLESPLIRQRIFIAVTTIPDSSYCSGGGWSIINEFDALDGSRPAKPTFDVTGNEDVEVGGVTKSMALINESDNIKFNDSDTGEDVWAAATGILKPGGGILHLSESSIVELPGAAPKREKKILSSSIGVIQEVVELAPKRGIAFWREH